MGSQEVNGFLNKNNHSIHKLSFIITALKQCSDDEVFSLFLKIINIKESIVYGTTRNFLDVTCFAAIIIPFRNAKKMKNTKNNKPNIILSISFIVPSLISSYTLYNLFDMNE
jgi:hypothetical protein